MSRTPLLPYDATTVIFRYKLTVQPQSGVQLNKHEFELQRLVIHSNTFSRMLGLAKHFVTMGAVVYSIYLILQGLGQIAGHKADSLNALALVIEKLQISGILSYLVAAATSTGWLLERKGKQRAYKQLGELRSQNEAGDPYHGSSNLDHKGQTPS
jgi:hypothetical protein